MKIIKLALLISFAVVGFTHSAHADNYGYNRGNSGYNNYNYDYKSGNSYNTRTDLNGSTTTNGYNSRKGDSWRSTTDSSGNQKGTDAKGNSWSYDNRTGNYMNYGTGKTCFGKGEARNCY